jgi:hypothetical protein
LVSEVVDEADALGGERIPYLGGLRDALDDLLQLVAVEESQPHSIDHLAVDQPDHGALHGLALDRAHDRLLGDRLDRVLDPGRPGDALRSSRAGTDQPPGD